MTTITRNVLTAKSNRQETKVRKALWTKYLDYAESKSNEGILWYLKVIIAIPCVFMVLSIMAMSMITPNFIWFIGVSMALFFANVIAHIGGATSRVFIPLYHATVLLFVAIPFITYLIN